MVVVLYKPLISSTNVTLNPQFWQPSLDNGPVLNALHWTQSFSSLHCLCETALLIEIYFISKVNAYRWNFTEVPSIGIPVFRFIAQALAAVTSPAVRTHLKIVQT